jgi:hypothetical protein
LGQKPVKTVFRSRETCAIVLVVALEAKREPIELLEEHIASRKEWSAYVELVTKVHRSVASEADAFLTDLRTRIELALRGAGEPPQSC